MTLYADIPGVAMQVSRDVVVASIQVDLDNDVLARFRDDLLRRIHEARMSTTEATYPTPHYEPCSATSWRQADPDSP